MIYSFFLFTEDSESIDSCDATGKNDSFNKRHYFLKDGKSFEMYGSLPGD